MSEQPIPVFTSRNSIILSFVNLLLGVLLFVVRIRTARLPFGDNDFDLPLLGIMLFTCVMYAAALAVCVVGIMCAAVSLFLESRKRPAIV